MGAAVAAIRTSGPWSGREASRAQRRGGGHVHPNTPTRSRENAYDRRPTRKTKSPNNETKVPKRKRRSRIQICAIERVFGTRRTAHPERVLRRRSTPHREAFAFLQIDASKRAHPDQESVERALPIGRPWRERGEESGEVVVVVLVVDVRQTTYFHPHPFGFFCLPFAEPLPFASFCC
jgi:hypothetical protein